MITITPLVETIERIFEKLKENGCLFIDTEVNEMLINYKNRVVSVPHIILMYVEFDKQTQVAALRKFDFCCENQKRFRS